MISTFQALAVAAIALLPGAMYVWGFEATVGGRWGIQLADRIPDAGGVLRLVEKWADVGSR